MGRHAKTIAIVDAARAALEAHRPMTVRQVFYQLVSRQVIDNTKGQYKAVCNALRDARKEGAIPWEWIEDRLRRPRQVGMWADVADFAETARQAYRRNVWATQGRLVEVWLEKDALSGIFEDTVAPYGVTVNVGRGFDGWDSIRNAAMRYLGRGGPVTVLYWGDFDPSGRDMVRSLAERLAFFGACPEMRICAILPGDIKRYQLPPDNTKVTDTRRAAFVARYGDVAVELDALPIDVLRKRLQREVERLLDLDALAALRAQETTERLAIVEALRAV